MMQRFPLFFRVRQRKHEGELGIKLEKRGLGTHQVDIHIQERHGSDICDWLGARNLFFFLKSYLLVNFVGRIGTGSVTSDILGLRGLWLGVAARFPPRNGFFGTGKKTRDQTGPSLSHKLSETSKRSRDASKPDDDEMTAVPPV